MFGTMIMLNLFIGVILNSMDEAEKERELERMAALEASGEEPSVANDVDDLRRQVASLQEGLDRLSLRMK